MRSVKVGGLTSISQWRCLAMKPAGLFLSLLLLVLFCTDAIAKGYPDKIVIQGNNLDRPIEITDRNTLGKFSPWYGQFIDWANGPVAKPNDRSSYEVLFYMSVRDRKSPKKPMVSRLIFNFLYTPDQAGGPGLIYLPARSDDKYRINQAAITRDKDDGRWHQASAAWDGVLKPLLPVKQPKVVIQKSAASPTRSIFPWLVAVGILGGAALVVKKKFNNLASGKLRARRPIPSGVRCL